MHILQILCLLLMFECNKYYYYYYYYKISYKILLWQCALICSTVSLIITHSDFDELSIDIIILEYFKPTLYIYNVDAVCIACGKTVRPRQEALQCDGCNLWQHRTCGTGISMSEYRQAAKSGFIDWSCDRCACYKSNRTRGREYPALIHIFCRGNIKFLMLII